MAWQGQTRRGGTIGFEQGSALSGQISAWGRNWGLGAAPWPTPQPSASPGAVLLPSSMRIAAVYPRQAGQFRVGQLVSYGGSNRKARPNRDDQSLNRYTAGAAVHSVTLQICNALNCTVGNMRSN